MDQDTKWRLLWRGPQEMQRSEPRASDPIWTQPSRASLRCEKICSLICMPSPLLITGRYRHAKNAPHYNPFYRATRDRSVPNNVFFTKTPLCFAFYARSWLADKASSFLSEKLSPCIEPRDMWCVFNSFRKLEGLFFHPLVREFIANPCMDLKKRISTWISMIFGCQSLITHTSVDIHIDIQAWISMQGHSSMDIRKQ